MAADEEDDDEAAQRPLLADEHSNANHVTPEEKVAIVPTVKVPGPQRTNSIAVLQPSPHLFWSFTAKQKLILFSLAMVELTTNMSLSVLAPFFPQEAERKHVTTSVSGWVFGVFAFVQFLAAPIIGKLLPVLGARFLFLIGPFFAGGCTILFGLLDLISVEDGNGVFLAYCFVLRVFMALGCSCGSTSSFAITAETFPDNIAFTFGVLETFAGLGMMIGPAVGGALYSAGGFMLPFLVIGSVMMVSTPWNYFILPRYTVVPDTSGAHRGSICELLRVPAISISCVAVVVGALVWSILDPTLEPHLAEFDINAGMLGLVFLLMSAFYAIGSPISGWLCDKIPDSSPLLVAGFTSCGVGMLLLGPSPLLGFAADYNELWLNIVALIVLGISTSISIVPTFDKILDAADKAGIEDNLRMYGLVAGLWSSMYALGDFIGPSIGGVLVDMIGFPWCMTVIAIICIGMAFIMLLLWLYEIRCGPTPILSCSPCCSCCQPDKEKRQPAENEQKTDENTPLLSSQNGVNNNSVRPPYVRSSSLTLQSSIFRTSSLLNTC